MKKIEPEHFYFITLIIFFIYVAYGVIKYTLNA